MRSAVILDTNVFVAAGFNRRSASARIVNQVRDGQLRMVWSDHTRRETEYILGKIPPLSWHDVEPLFRQDDRYDGDLDTAAFQYIADPDDRKYAALSQATGAVLVTADDHLLSGRGRATVEILTPSEFCRHHG